MSSAIKDKFTKLKVGKRRKYQMRNKAKGLCVKCPKKQVKWGLCDGHYRKQLRYYKASQKRLQQFGKMKPVLT